MGLFGDKESKEEKQARKERELLEKYGLTQVDERDIDSIRKIISDLAGNDLIKTGMALSFSKAEDQAKVSYLSALVEQNWIIIRQLDRLNKQMSSSYNNNFNFYDDGTII